MLKSMVRGTLAAAIICAATAVQAEVSSISIGVQHGVAYLPLQVVGINHLVEKHAKLLGIPLTATVINLGQAGMIRDALIAGQIQFGVAGPPTLVTMHDKTKGDIKAIGAVVSVPIYLNTANPKIKKVCDFGEGDKIALPTIKSSVQAVTLQMAAKKQCGDPFKVDSFTVGMTHPDGYNALMSGMVSTHMTTPPYSFAELEKGKGKIRLILNSYDVLGAKSTLVLLLGSDKFRQENPKVYQAMRDALEEGEAFVRQKPKEAAAIYLKVEKSKETYAEVMKQIASPEIVYTTTPIALGKYAKFMFDIGTVKTDYSWKDLSMPDLQAKKGS